MASVFDVASYILKLAKKDVQEDEYDITHMKLQKLIYYCQGFSLALLDKPLFPEPIKAWKHGPVCQVLYNQLKDSGSMPIYEIGNKESSLDEEEKKIIKLVYSYYGQYSASKLRNMTHAEHPWQSVANGSPISRKRIREYFIKKYIEVNPKDMHSMSETEHNETIAALEEIEKTGEVNLLSCR
jgi:uncharacterized phage-associated protein